ncbi:NAD(P)-binding domain-containing protein [Embleya scabrispora]|uniref:NAD(P)-binding domain-containing protein n=1 Tax=Embleya scabrispora TaxID=159449 RepID=UPI0039C87827
MIHQRGGIRRTGQRGRSDGYQPGRPPDTPSPESTRLQGIGQAHDQSVRVAGFPAETAADADVVVTVLPGGTHVLDCYQGPDGLLGTAPVGAVFVDCSTIDVADARAAVRATGRRAVDAPVFGGVVGAVAGTLTLVVGAQDENFAAIEPVLTPRWVAVSCTAVRPVPDRPPALSARSRACSAAASEAVTNARCRGCAVAPPAR